MDFNDVLHFIGFCVLVLTAVFAGVVGVASLVNPRAAEATRESCECRELRAIRRMLEMRLQIVCDGSRCLPAPTPTASTGGELP